MNKCATMGIWCLVLCLFLGVSSGAFAQGVTTAAINGTVTGKAGEALPGVNIKAVHNPSGTVYGTSTRGDGRFNLPNLRVGGPYSITASLVGYRSHKYEQVYLQLSQNLDMNFSLVEEAVQQSEVLVTGELSSVFNASRTGAATNVSRDQIDRLPSISRNFQDYLKASPYFAGGSNAVGRNSKYNNIQIDGGDFNDLFGLGSTGTPAGQMVDRPVTPISLDAIEEFQVAVSPYDVRQAGFTGAGVNAITRSGTNDYKASAFYFGRNQDLMGKSPDALKLSYPNFTDYKLGARVGGPILANSLFFFANAEMTRFKAPITRTFDAPSIGTNAYPASTDSLTMLTNYLKTKYGYDPGSFNTVGNNSESDKLFFRLDYNLSENHKLTARYNYLRSSDDNSPSRGRRDNSIYFDNGKYKLENTTHSLALQLTSVFGNYASNELIVGYTNQFDNPIFYGTAFPTLYIATKGTNAAKSDMYLVLGAEQFRHHNELGQKFWEITDNFSYYLAEHTVTVGARVDLFQFRNLFISSAFGAYSYSSIARFLQSDVYGPDANPSGASNDTYTYRYSATADPLQEANWGANQFAVYAQDEWKVNSALKLTAGLRLDIPTYPDHPRNNDSITALFGYRTDTPPKTQIAFSPRIGFNWAVNEERDIQLRGGVGVFYGRFPYVWVSNQYSNTGVDFYTLGKAFAPTKFIADPYGQPKPASNTLPTAEVDVTDPDFKAPSIWRYDIALDYKLPLDLVATVEGIFSVTQNDVYYQNLNLTSQPQGNGGLTANGVIVGEGRPVWGTASASGTFSPVLRNKTVLGTNGLYLVRNTSQGSNANIIFQIQRNLPEGLIGSVGYAWGMAKDISSGNSTTASSGWSGNSVFGNPNDPQLSYSQWDRRHRIFGTLSYRKDWGAGFATTVGLFYNGMSGRPFSYLVSGDVNGDGQSSNDLAYVPRDESDILLVNSSNVALAKTDVAYSQLFTFINSDDYLKDHKGQVAERNAPREPWLHQIDLHLGQDIPTIAGQKIEITFDILNVLNLLNSDWGWVKQASLSSANLLTFKGLTTTAGPDYGKARYQLGSNVKFTDGKADPCTPDNLLSRWQMQIGIRYTL